jgi:hypothetical protein
MLGPEPYGHRDDEGKEERHARIVAPGLAATAGAFLPLRILNSALRERLAERLG